ncbi:hypothetical protein ACLOJK_032290 [Asimina triloba]
MSDAGPERGKIPPKRTAFLHFLEYPSNEINVVKTEHVVKPIIGWFGYIPGGRQEIDGKGRNLGGYWALFVLEAFTLGRKGEEESMIEDGEDDEGDTEIEETMLRLPGLAI